MIYTSYFARIKTHLPPGMRALSIALRQPDGWPQDDTCPALIPPPFILDQYRAGNLTDYGYEMRYRQFRLENLSAQWILDFYDNCVLCCYESPDKFCHRHVVHAWILEQTGVQVQELDQDVNTKEIKSLPKLREARVEQLSLF